MTETTDIKTNVGFIRTTMTFLVSKHHLTDLVVTLEVVNSTNSCQSQQFFVITNISTNYYYTKCC